MKEKNTAVAIKKDINMMLTEIQVSRVGAGNLVNSKVSIVAELIMKAHKREVK